MSPSRSDRTVILSPQSAVTTTAAVQHQQSDPINYTADITKETLLVGTGPVVGVDVPEEGQQVATVNPSSPALVHGQAHNASQVNHDAPSSHATTEGVDIAACGYAAEPDAGTPPPFTGAQNMHNLLCPAAADWDSSDFEPTPPRRTQPPVVVPVETRGRKKGKATTLCTKSPPEPIVPRDEGCDPISMGKLVWILHDNFPLVAVAQGKAGVAWRTKSNKLGAQCSPGHQWIQVHRVFQHTVPLMFPEPEVGCSYVESALPPAQGRHKQIMWSSRHLVSFKP